MLSLYIFPGYIVMPVTSEKDQTLPKTCQSDGSFVKNLSDVKYWIALTTIEDIASRGEKTYIPR